MLNKNICVYISVFDFEYILWWIYIHGMSASPVHNFSTLNFVRAQSWTQLTQTKTKWTRQMPSIYRIVYRRHWPHPACKLLVWRNPYPLSMSMVENCLLSTALMNRLKCIVRIATVEMTPACSQTPRGSMHSNGLTVDLVLYDERSIQLLRCTHVGARWLQRGLYCILLLGRYLHKQTDWVVIDLWAYIYTVFI